METVKRAAAVAAALTVLAACGESPELSDAKEAATRSFSTLRSQTSLLCSRVLGTVNDVTAGSLARNEALSQLETHIADAELIAHWYSDDKFDLWLDPGEFPVVGLATSVGYIHDGILEQDGLLVEDGVREMQARCESARTATLDLP